LSAPQAPYSNTKTTKDTKTTKRLGELRSRNRPGAFVVLVSLVVLVLESALARQRPS
jgi:hypothetical protein